MSLERNIYKYSEAYAVGELDFEHIQVQFRRKKVLEVLNKYSPKNILEIGCGYDSIANYYGSYDNFTIVEPSAKFASQAVKNHDSCIQLYVDFLENKVNDLKKQEFDFIILSCLLHEVVDPVKFLMIVKSLCSEETIVHINVPNSRGFHLLWAYASGLMQNLDELTPTANALQHNTAFNIDKLCNLAQEAGLCIIEKGTYFVKPFNHKKMSALVNDGTISEQLLDGLYELTKFMPEAGSEIFVNCKLR